jgi:hypothetical protein
MIAARTSGGHLAKQPIDSLNPLREQRVGLWSIGVAPELHAVQGIVCDIFYTKLNGPTTAVLPMLTNQVVSYDHCDLLSTRVALEPAPDRPARRIRLTRVHGAGLGAGRRSGPTRARRLGSGVASMSRAGAWSN